jgi:hypothetical protein
MEVEAELLTLRQTTTVRDVAKQSDVSETPMLRTGAVAVCSGRRNRVGIVRM